MRDYICLSYSYKYYQQVKACRKYFPSLYSPTLASFSNCCCVLGSAAYEVEAGQCKTASALVADRNPLLATASCATSNA